MTMRLLGQLGLALIAAASLGVAVWQTRSIHPGPSTLTSGPVAATASGPARILAEGRLETRPGARITVSSEIAGVVTNMAVREGSRVQAGELLAEIRADDTYASWMEARARMAELDAEIRLATAEHERGQALATTGAATQQELDRLAQHLDTLRARRTTAQVTVQRLDITIAKTRIGAPLAGTVLTRHIHPGEVVQGGTPIVTLADLDRVWIEAEVDEYDSSRVRLGADAIVRAEGNPAAWRGRVEEIPDQVGPRALHPLDPARPSDVRVLRVKVALLQPTPLKLGQRVEVELAAGE